MRLLHCIPTLGLGGAERQVVCLAEGLQASGQEVHLAVLRPEGPYEERLVRRGVALHRLHWASHHDPRILGQLFSLIRHLRPHVVQTWLPMMDVAGGLAALVTGTPWVLSERNSAPGYPPSFKNLVRRGLGERASAVVANSAAGLSYWSLGRCSGGERLVIANAIARAEIDAAAPADSDAVGLTSGRPLVVFAGRLERSKNLEQLVRATARPLLRDRVSMVVCGEGPQRGALEALRAELGVASVVHLLGRRDDVWGWMKRAAVFVSPSRFEGMPNAVVEAMTCGCPLVVSDIPAHREILDETSAVFVDPDDPVALTEGIVRLLDDPATAALLGAAARIRAAQWTVAGAVTSYLALYHRLAGRQ